MKRHLLLPCCCLAAMSALSARADESAVLTHGVSPSLSEPLLPAHESSDRAENLSAPAYTGAGISVYWLKSDALIEIHRRDLRLSIKQMATVTDSPFSTLPQAQRDALIEEATSTQWVLEFSYQF